MADAPPRLLLIETSARVGRVGLAEGPVLLAEDSLDEARRHLRDLAPSVARLLRERGWAPRDLGGVIVSLGPGSYTGLRVGIMSAKMLAYATSCALIGAPTFEVIARQAKTAGRKLIVIADAQRENLYVQSFSRNSATDWFKPAGELIVTPERQWAQNLPPDVGVVGPGVRIAAPWLPAGTLTALLEPAIADLLAVGWERFEQGLLDDPVRLEPLYLRPSSAEEQWDRRASDGVTGSRSGPSS
jgi:tRNA threonylcarbamoyladenosine biosynthesis protein TsaB